MITGGGGRIVIERVAEPVPPLFVALIATVDVPAPLGVSEMAPVLVLTERPPGRALAA